MSSAKRSEERTFILECIRLYRALPSLWKIKSDEYSNRNKKSQDYKILLHKYQEKYPNATVDDIKKRFNALRTNFRKELRKIASSKKSGAGAEDVVESTLWYYEEMSFLREQEMPSDSINTIDEEDCEDLIEENVSISIFFILLAKNNNLEIKYIHFTIISLNYCL